MKQMLLQNHKWSFFKAGGFFQVNIETGDDIVNLGSLDQTLWAALSVPTKGVWFDAKTMEILDIDGDGHLHISEIVAASNWVVKLLKNPDILIGGAKVLKLDDIDDSTEEGAVLLSSAREVLKNLGRPNGDVISVDDFADEKKIYASSLFNADGIIIADSSPDQRIKDAIGAIISVMEASVDRSGKLGVSEAAVKEFYERFDAYNAWRAKADPAILPFGDDTSGLYASFSAVEKKIDEYFEFSEILKYDPSSAASFSPDAEHFGRILAGENSQDELAKLPLIKIDQHGILNMDSAFNPAWIPAVEAFKKGAFAKVYPDKKELTRNDWTNLREIFAPYSLWLSQKDDRGISTLSPGAFKLLSDETIKLGLEELIAKDWDLKDEVENVSKLEKLVRLSRDFYELLINFVNFKSFYKRDGKAIFQIGRLFLDQRECDLCIFVDDPAKHVAMSPMSYLYLVYCTCTRKGEDPISIAAAVTGGNSDNLIIGRNGLFYDRFGRDWDATITRIVANPIGVRQAFWSPYKRIMALVSEQIAKRASALDSKVVGDIAQKTVALAHQPPPPDKKIDVGTVAALGVAVGGITTAFGMVLAALGKIQVWTLPLLIIGFILLISLPSVIIAAMKLNLRNLAPLLDANMWAVNTRAKLNFHLGTLLTRVPKIPRKSRHDPDPFESRKPYGKIIFFSLLLGVLAVGALEWKYSFIRKYFGHKAEAAQTTPPASPDSSQKSDVKTPGPAPAPTEINKK